MVLRIPLGTIQLHLRGSHPLLPPFPERSVRRPVRDRGPTTPSTEAAGLGCSAFARHYSRNTCLFLGLRRCFSSPGSLTRRCNASSSHWVSPFGDRWLITSAHDLPALIAVYHVLHRHLTPRHPPCALNRFVRSDTEKPTRSGVCRLVCVSSCVFLSVIVKVPCQSLWD